MNKKVLIGIIVAILAIIAVVAGVIIIISHHNTKNNALSAMNGSENDNMLLGENEQKENEEDIYGHDGINLITPIMGKTHLTLMFQILGFNSNIKHRISLVATEGTVPDANGYMAVELRHNAEGDRQEYPSSGYVSFPLLDVPGYKEGKLQGFKIKMNTINNGEETVTVSYNKSKSTNFPFIQKDISNTKIK